MGQPGTERADLTSPYRQRDMWMNSNAPTITTVIPTYRRPMLLKRAVRSVLAQTYPDLLVCIYDNASGDDTADVVSGLAQEDERARYCRNSENIGWLKNFAKGMS